MNPIAAAIIAGIASRATDEALMLVKDAYAALKRALNQKCGADSKLVEAINTLEAEPDFAPNQQILVGRVEQARAAEDPELLSLAQALIEALQTTAEGNQALAKYQINVSGAQVGIIGDGATIAGGIHFGGTGGHSRPGTERADSDEHIPS